MSIKQVGKMFEYTGEPVDLGHIVRLETAYPRVLDLPVLSVLSDGGVERLIDEVRKAPFLWISNVEHEHFTLHRLSDRIVALPRTRLGRLSTALDQPERVTTETLVAWKTEQMEAQRRRCRVDATNSSGTPSNLHLFSMPMGNQEEVFVVRDLKRLLDQKVESVFLFKAIENDYAVYGADDAPFKPIRIGGYYIKTSERHSVYRGFALLIDAENIGPEREALAVPILADSVKMCCPTFEDEIVIKVSVHDEPSIALWFLKSLIDRVLTGEHLPGGARRFGKSSWS